MKINSLFSLVSKSSDFTKDEKKNIYAAIRYILSSKLEWNGKNSIQSMYENLEKVKSLLEENDFDSERLFDAFGSLDEVKDVLIEDGIISDTDTDSDDESIHKVEATIIKCNVEIPGYFVATIYYVAFIATVQVGISAFRFVNSFV